MKKLTTDMGIASLSIVYAKNKADTSGLTKEEGQANQLAEAQRGIDIQQVCKDIARLFGKDETFLNTVISRDATVFLELQDILYEYSHSIERPKS